MTEKKQEKADKNGWRKHRTKRNYIKNIFLLNYQTQQIQQKDKGPTRYLIFRRSARFQSNKGIVEKVVKRKSETHTEHKRKISSAYLSQFNFTADSTFATVPNRALLQVTLLTILVQNFNSSVINYYYGNSLIPTITCFPVEIRTHLYLLVWIFPIFIFFGINFAEFSRIW